jgi:methylaspartate ammonia-lyase
MVWVSVIGLITNLAIVVFTHKAFGLSSAGDRWVLFLFIEHSLLLVKFVISLIIPDMPVPVKQGGIWGERIVKEKVLHAKVDDGKMKSILAARTVDPEKLLEANKVFELA